MPFSFPRCLRRSTLREVPNQHTTLSLTHRPKQTTCLKQTCVEQRLYLIFQCLSHGKLITKSGRTKGHIYVRAMLEFGHRWHVPQTGHRCSIAVFPKLEARLCCVGSVRYAAFWRPKCKLLPYYDTSTQGSPTKGASFHEVS